LDNFVKIFRDFFMTFLLLCLLNIWCPDFSALGFQVAESKELKLSTQVPKIWKHAGFPHEITQVEAAHFREDWGMLFEDMDVDRNASISAHEVVSFYEKEPMEVQICTLFSLLASEMDEDHNRSISYSEWSGFGQRWMSSLKMDDPRFAQAEFGLDRFRHLDLNGDMLLSMQELLSVAPACSNQYASTMNRPTFQMAPR
jgi:hypothetical protein